MRLRQIIQLKKFIVFLTTNLLPLFAFCGEGEIVSNGPITTRFVTESNIDQTSKTIEIGWWIKRDRGWHTYWESPGDVGVPPNLEWELPSGISFREMLFAPPQLVKMFQVFAHGHRKETLFICSFDVSRELVVGETLSFKAKASWLTCFKTCVPAYDDLEISIPVESEPQLDNKWYTLFEKFRAENPVEAPKSWLLESEAKLSKPPGSKKEYVTVRFPYPNVSKLPTFRFFAHGRYVLSNIFQVPQVYQDNQGNKFLDISMELSYWRDSEKKYLEGLLFRSDGWPETSSKFYKVMLPIR